MQLEEDAPHRSQAVDVGCGLMESGPAVQSAGSPSSAGVGHLPAQCDQLHRTLKSMAGDESRNRGWGGEALATRQRESRNPRRNHGGGLVKGAAVLLGVLSLSALSGVRGSSSALSLSGSAVLMGMLPLSTVSSVPARRVSSLRGGCSSALSLSGSASSPAYANMFEVSSSSSLLSLQVLEGP